MITLKRSKTKKGTTLTEVMIVLGIISTVLVTSVSVLINSLMKVKLNDIDDAATGIMIQGLEIAKTPSGVGVTSLPLSEAIFSLEHDDQLGNYLENRHSDEITECTAESIYNVSRFLDEDLSNYDICLQIRIEYSYAINAYKITSEVTYNVPTEVKTNQIIGYRYGDLERI